LLPKGPRCGKSSLISVASQTVDRARGAGLIMGYV
jgi:hypothetical protein